MSARGAAGRRAAGRGGAAHHHQRAHDALELLGEAVVHGGLPHEPAQPVADTANKLAVLPPRPAPHAVPAEGAVGEVREAGEDLEGARLARDVRALLVVHQPLVPGQPRVHVHADALAHLQPHRRIKLQLDELVGGGRERALEPLGPVAPRLVLPLVRVRRRPHRHRPELAAHPHALHLEVVQRQRRVARQVEHDACAAGGGGDGGGWAGWRAGRRRGAPAAARGARARTAEGVVLVVARVGGALLVHELLRAALEGEDGGRLRRLAPPGEGLAVAAHLAPAARAAMLQRRHAPLPHVHFRVERAQARGAGRAARRLSGRSQRAGGRSADWFAGQGVQDHQWTFIGLFALFSLRGYRTTIYDVSSRLSSIPRTRLERRRRYDSPAADTAAQATRTCTPAITRTYSTVSDDH